MKGFAYLQQGKDYLTNIYLKYPDDMPDDPTLDDLADYIAKHRLEEGPLIHDHGIHTKLFLQLVQDKRHARMKKLWSEDEPS
jgi:hypothetical protein